MKIIEIIADRKGYGAYINVFILLFAYLSIMTAPAFATPGMDCPCCQDDLASCSDSSWVGHEAHDCRKDCTMMEPNDSELTKSHPSTRDAKSSTTSGLPQDRYPSKILVPLYIYPDMHADDSYWKAVAEAQAKVDITAIINPNNGPHKSTLEPSYGDYQRGIQMLRHAKVQILGYVHTSYGKRDKKKIEDDIDQYARHYDVDGIFFDEASNLDNDKDFYARLTAHTRMAPKLKTIVLNPGVATTPAYIDGQRLVTDIAVTFEQTYDHWITISEPPDWVYHKAADRFALLVHTTPDIAAMKRAIDLGRKRHYGYIYITNDMGENPWDTLPAYWPEMVDYIKQLNETRMTRHVNPIIRLVNFFTGNRFKFNP